MPTEALSCPSCNANDSSRSDANGVHTCVYCGVRYRILGGTPRAVADAAQRPRLVAVAVAGTLLVGVGAAVATSRSPAAPQGSPSAPAPTGLAPLGDAPIGLAPAGDTHPGDAPRSPPAPAPTVSVDAPAPVVVVPEPPAAAHFELTHRRPGAGTTFYAVGYVTNDSDYAIDQPKITAVMKDAAGAEVGTSFGYADGVLGANATEPVEVLVMNPPAFATIEFEIVPRRAIYIPPQVDGLRVEPGPVRAAAFGRFDVDGKVVHGGTAPTRFVHVRATAFDDTGRLIGVDGTYADAEVLQPGASARFNLSMRDLGATAARWEFSVRGSTVD